MFSHKLRLLVAVIASMSAAHESLAVSFRAPPGTTVATDLINNPNNIEVFEDDVITWKMSSLFKFVFDDPVLQDQVRLGFNEWSIASDSQLRRDSPRYSWTRWNGNRNFFDLRTVITHELGHMLGSQHPDAVWFNSNYHLNFVPDGAGGWIAAPPIGGEIMNEGNAPGLPGAKPDKGLRGGEYWRTLSHDELDLLDYGYGRHFDFQEVGENDDAMITLKISNLFGQPGSGSSLGAGGPDSSDARDPNDDLGGRWIRTASAFFNAAKPMGIQPLSLAWEFTNHTGKTVDALSIRTEGTSNRNPLDASSAGGHRFTHYEPSNASLLYQFENVGHHFTDPAGGGVPDGSTVQVGLQQDVWDWYSTSATVHTTDGQFLPANLSSIIPWGVGDFAGEAPDGLPDWDVGRDDQFNTKAAGFRILNGDQPTVITEIAFASIAGMEFGLNDLTSDGLALLEAQGLVSHVPISPITLAPGGEFVVVLEGQRADLPVELKNSGNYVISDFPGDFNEQELFVYALGTGSNQSVATFGLLNSDPILGLTIPEPEALHLAGLAVCVLALLRPRHTLRRCDE